MSKLSALREAGFYGLSNIVNQAMAFIAMIFVSRYLGPTNLGLLAFVQNYSGIFLSLIAGADYYFSWEIGKRENKLDFIKEYITHRLYFTLLVLLFGLGFAFYTFPKDLLLYTLIVMSSFVFTVFSPLYLYSLYEKRAKLIFWVQTISMLFLFVCKILLVILKAPLIYFVIISSIDIALNSLLYLYYYLSTHTTWKNKLLKFKFFNPLKTLYFYFDIRYAILAPLLWVLLMRADQLMLGFLTSKIDLLKLGESGAYNLGIYNAAVKLAEIPNTLASIVYLVLISRMVKIVEKADEVRLKKVFNFYILSGGIFALFIYIFAPIMVSLVYGSKFQDSINVLKIYGISIVFVYVITYYLALLGAKDQHRFQSFVFLLGVVINMALVILLTPVFGLVGTAWATVISYGLVACIFFIKNRN
jgi:PST family polysaccharide transporter